MRRSFALLGVLTWYLAAPDTSPRRVETFGDWSLRSQVGRAVNTSISTTRTPILSRDELTMYFTSDRPGGLGGDDLWFATRESARRSVGQTRRTCARSIPVLRTRSRCFPPTNT